MSVEDMIKATDRGILLGRFWYIRSVDPRIALQTGLTRDGIWYIENGKIQYPVTNFRFNQSLMQLLAPGNVDMIGKPERVGSAEGQGGSSSLLPALKVKEFHFTSAVGSGLASIGNIRNEPRNHSEWTLNSLSVHSCDFVVRLFEWLKLWRR